MGNAIETTAFETDATREVPADAPIATYTFRPHDDTAIALHKRDAALWALVERLVPGEKLTLTYAFPGPGADRPELRVTVSGRDTGWGGYETLETADAETRRAVEMAFPGFLARRVAAATLPAARPLRLPGIAVPLAKPRRSRLSPKPAEAMVETGPILPLPGKPFQLDGVLAALAGSVIEGELQVHVAPFAVAAPVLRALDEVGDLGAFAPMASGLGHLSMAERARLRHEVGLWREASLGVSVSLAVSGAVAENEVLCGAFEHVLGAAPRGCEIGRGFDLSGLFPSGSTLLPGLTPEPKTLQELGFRESPMPRTVDLAGAMELGTDLAERPVRISRRDCALHSYLIGATGVGKSTLIANMVRQDIKAGRAVVVVDPHGDLFEDIRSSLTSGAAHRAVIADVGDFARPFGLNILEVRGEPQAVHRNFVANQLIGVFKSVLYRDVPEAFGPMFEAYFRNALLLLMDAGGPESTLADFDRLFGEASYRRQLLDECSDETIVRFWRQIATRAGGDSALENIAPYICSKLTQLTGNALLRPIVTAARTTLDFETAMADGRVCLVNLAKGLVGSADAALLGGLIVIRLFSAAMARVALPPAERTPVRVYLDEFPTYAGEVLNQMLAECRKFGIELVLANQGLGQIDGTRHGSAHAILSNVANVLAFRTGPDDARRLAEWFGPEVDPLALTRLPDHTFVARLLAGGTPTAPTRVRAHAPSDPAK